MAGPESLNYGQLMQKAMRRMTAEVLGHVAEHGLPGDHHFYISFETGHPGVDMPDWLRDTYPEEMTIVLQDWFADLAVTQDRFSVTLNFSDQPQALVIPLDAIRTFVDPSVKFGLKFDAHEASETDAEFPGEEPLEDEAEEPVVEDDREPETTGAGAEVVSLDKFRKT